MAGQASTRTEQALLIRRIVITVLRVMFTAAIILVLLTPAPALPDGRLQTQLTVLAYLTVWAVVFFLVFRWQVRRVARAEHPQTSLVEALAVIFVLFVAVFAKIYHMLSLAYPASFTEALDFFSSVYFSLTVLATVGFGDITPVTQTARLITMIQIVLDLILLGVAVRVVSGAASRSLVDRRAAESGKLDESGTSTVEQDSSGSA